MATNTYVALDKITVGTATASVTFSSIPSTYTDLVIVTSIQRTATGNTRIRFNGDTGTNYSTTYIEGNGTAASSVRVTNQTYMTLDYSNSTSSWVPSIANIMNYANTTTNKTIINRTGDAGVVVLAYAQLWRNTAAINSITLLSDTTFAAGSTFSLYGIKAE
jgi:hypothetical protein